MKLFAQRCKKKKKGCKVVFGLFAALSKCFVLHFPTPTVPKLGFIFAFEIEMQS